LLKSKRVSMSDNPLPSGQISSDIFPRFGLDQYADRFPHTTDKISIQIGGEIADFDIEEEFTSLKRTKQNSDFHCVTTWTKQNLQWEGVRFRDFYESIVKNLLGQSSDFTFVIFKAQDGYKTGLFLEDLLADDVILADKLNGENLNIAHGAPIRLIAPAHYGYKNLKHLYRIEFYTKVKKVKQGFLSFMDHPRARVAFEERAVGGPGWVFRYLYRPLIKSTIKKFDLALKRREEQLLSEENVNY